MGGSMLKKVFLLSLFAVFFSIGVLSAPIGPDLGLVDYINMGEASSTISFDGGKNTTLLDEARVSELPVISNPLGVWKTVDLEPASRDVETYLNTSESDSSLIYPAEINLNISGLESGEYAVFFWSCKKNSTSNCKWLKPRKFTKPGRSSGGGCNPETSIRAGKDDVLREGDTGTYRAIVNDCPNGVEQYRWEVSRGGENIESSDGWSRSDEFSFELSEEIYEGNFNVTVEARTKSGIVSEKTEMWGVPKIPGDFFLSAHRGGTHAPHNTVMTIEQIRKAGADSIEFDVRVTGDEKLVVSHDKNTDKYSYGNNLDIDESALDTLTEINKGKNYNEDENTVLDVSKDAAKESEFASLDEVLDYVKRYDLHMRIELKGSLQGSREHGRDLYEKVRDRDLLDQSVFMSFRGSCPSGPAFISSDRPKSSGCDWDALEAIEEASSHEAKTAMLYASRNFDDKPEISGSWADTAVSVGRNAWGNIDSVSPTEALNYAGNESLDMIVPADDDPKDYGAGFKSYPGGIDRLEFVERARAKGLEYSFMWFRGDGDDGYKRFTEQVKCGAEWISVETESEIEKITDVNEQRFSEDISFCEFDGKTEDESILGAVMNTVTVMERGWGVGLTQAGDAINYGLNYPGDTLNRGFEGTKDLIENPSISNAIDKGYGAWDQVSEPVDVAGNTMERNIQTTYRESKRLYNDWDEATQDQQDRIVQEYEDGRDRVEEEIEETGEDVKEGFNDGVDTVQDGASEAGETICNYLCP